ncbi:MAG: hypothetical protein R2856_35025 [Caldilineaceae bacterium]
MSTKRRQVYVQRVIFAAQRHRGGLLGKRTIHRFLLGQRRLRCRPPSCSMITHESPIRPRGDYGSSKAWGEAAARQFVDSSDLSILCLRIGHVTEEDRPMSVRDYSVWCSQRDIGQMIALCVAAPADLRFGVFFVVSENKWGYRDINHARQVLGFEPQDAAEDYR